MEVLKRPDRGGNDTLREARHIHSHEPLQPTAAEENEPEIRRPRWRANVKQRYGLGQRAPPVSFGALRAWHGGARRPPVLARGLGLRALTWSICLSYSKALELIQQAQPTMPAIINMFNIILQL